MKQFNQLSFKGQSIFIGIDVHKKSWTVSLFSETNELRTMSVPPSVESLRNYLNRFYPEANYESVYEAGFCGYWIHQKLIKCGIKNIIVNPADVPTTDKEKKRKTDPRDSRKLGKSLRSGELSGIFIRSEAKLNDRMLVRTRHDNVRKQTRCKNQIKAVLNFFGIQLQMPDVKTHWSKAYIRWLDSLCKDNKGSSLRLKLLLEELDYYRNSISKLTKAIRALSNSSEYKLHVELLCTIPGISILTAMTILTEFGEINIYNGIDKLSSYVGIIPDEHSSGDNENKTSITKRGNPFLRKVLIEASWTAVRKDPAMQLAFRKYCSRTLPTKAIIKISKKLLNRIRYVLINEKPYELMKN